MRVQGLLWISAASCAVLPFTAALALAAPPTVSVAGTYVGEAGEITLTSLANGKLHVHFALRAVGLPNVGSGDADAVVKNGASRFKLDGYSACAMSMKFSNNGELNVTQSGMPQECGFGAHVTAEGTYLRGKPIAPLAPAKAELDVPGAPSDAECKPSNSRAQTTAQLALDEQQANLATVAGCAMRAAYERLDKSAPSRARLADKLRAAQAAWSAFSDAHQVERFPHRDEPGYYGSVLGRCYGSENQQSYQARTLELRGMQPCKAGPSTLTKAETDAKAAELALREVLTKLRANYRREPRFMLALGKAQLAFEAWRRAQATYIEALTDGNAVCSTREFERLTRARTKQLSLWFNPVIESDPCRGSYGPP